MYPLIVPAIIMTITLSIPLAVYNFDYFHYFNVLLHLLSFCLDFEYLTQYRVKTEFTAKRVALKASFDEKENNDHWKAFKAQQEKGDEKDAEEVQRLKDQFHQEEVTRQERRAAGRPDPHLKTEREYLRLAKERLALMVR